jgi:AraC-like DNA-binding protein/ligand-binding sensor protein
MILLQSGQATTFVTSIIGRHGHPELDQKPHQHVIIVSPMSLATSKQLLDELSRSEIYKDYERAFSEATGLPLNLRPVEDFHLAHHGKVHENPFCALMAKHSRTCAACLDAQQKSSDSALQQTRTIMCFAGLCESSVPLRTGENLIGFLQTGEVMLEKPTHAQFSKVASLLVKWGIGDELKEAEQAWVESKVVPRKQYKSVLRLLEIFALHLSLVANQLVIQRKQAEPPAITRARQFILEHQNEELSLTSVAKVVNMSSFYFCKTFKKATGLNFTDYLARMRIERAKELLLNPNARVSEIVFEVGFQSITHFNRIFKRHVGRSPSEYRQSLPRTA